MNLLTLFKIKNSIMQSICRWVLVCGSLSSLFFCTIHTQIFTHTVFIIIHGTWSANATWYMPGGDFFDAFKDAAQQKGDVVVPFCWSGKLAHQARVDAASILMQLILSYAPTTRICIVAHSHGGNIALMA